MIDRKPKPTADLSTIKSSKKRRFKVNAQKLSSEGKIRTDAGTLHCSEPRTILTVA